MEGDNHDSEIYNIHRLIHNLLVSDRDGTNSSVTDSVPRPDATAICRNRDIKAIPADFKVLDRHGTGHQ